MILDRLGYSSRIRWLLFSAIFWVVVFFRSHHTSRKEGSSILYPRNVELSNALWNRRTDLGWLLIFYHFVSTSFSKLYSRVL